MAKKKVTTLKKLAKKKFHLVNFQVTPEEFKNLKSKASSFTNGKMSAWLREAGLKYVPPKGDLE